RADGVELGARPEGTAGAESQVFHRRAATHSSLEKQHASQVPGWGGVWDGVEGVLDGRTVGNPTPARVPSRPRGRVPQSRLVRRLPASGVRALSGVAAGTR